jgi:DNA adenine methylase
MGLVDRAFQTILRNRTQRGGIMAPGATLMKRGENDKGLTSRWYAQTLHRRLLEIGSRADRIGFVHGDGLCFMQEHADDPATVWFIDPPYTVAGQRLYAHNELDHRELFRLTAQLRGDFLMTYDNNAFVRGLAAEFGFDTQTVAMRNTHNTIKSELLVGRNLGWCRARYPL